jgi:hypothetical protein
LQTVSLLLELFLAIDWSKSLYRVGRDPQPQKLTFAKGVCRVKIGKMDNVVPLLSISKAR